MNIEELSEEIEDDLTWRLDEIRFFQNLLAGMTEVERNQFHRAIVLLLYAHFEGFCRFAFQHYVKAVNKEGIKCREANYAIAAATIHEILQALRHNESKCAEFKNSLPDDAKLHLFAREREFVEKSEGFLDGPVQIPEGLIDTESNLQPVVLRKMLYQLGFSHDQFEPLEGTVHQLLNWRNKIAHGERKMGIDAHQLDELRGAVFGIMNAIKHDIMSALTKKTFLRAS